MRPVRVRNEKLGNYRPYRFPPVASVYAASTPSKPAQSETNLSGADQLSIQQRMMEGYDDGMKQGYEEGLSRGQQDGYSAGIQSGEKEGYRQGLSQGQTEGREIFDASQDIVSSLVNQMNAWLVDSEKAQRETVCELVLKVCKQVLRAELALVPQQIYGLVDETIKAMPERPERVSVLLNPVDLERINTINPDLPSEWHLIGDQSVPMYGCRIQTDQADADVSCESQLDHCMQNIREHLLEDDNGTEAANIIEIPREISANG